MTSNAPLRSILLTASIALLGACAGRAREAHITVDYPSGTQTAASDQPPIATDAASFEAATEVPAVAPPPATAPVAAPSATQELARPGYDAAALASARGFGVKEGEPTEVVMQSALTKANSEGSASVGGASVSGGTVPDVRAVIARMASGFRACYTRGLAEDPKARGSVRITVKIGANGEVLSTSATGGEGLPSTVIACVQARAATAMFSPPDGGKGATIVVPVTFQPQS